MRSFVAATQWFSTRGPLLLSWGRLHLFKTVNLYDENVVIWYQKAHFIKVVSIWKLLSLWATVGNNIWIVTTEIKPDTDKITPAKSVSVISFVTDFAS